MSAQVRTSVPSAAAVAAAMRCHTLPLLALAIVLVVLLPACDAIKCFTCEDPQPLNTGRLSSTFNISVTNSTLRSSVQDYTLTPCSQFSSKNEDLKVACAASQISCYKKRVNGRTTRGCHDIPISRDHCTLKDGDVDCYCTKDLCNSAGLTSPALLLLPAALLAALSRRSR